MGGRRRSAPPAARGRGGPEAEAPIVVGYFCGKRAAQRACRAAGGAPYRSDDPFHPRAAEWAADGRRRGRRLRLHPTNAHAAFARVLGMTIGEYIRRQRLRHAHAAAGRHRCRDRADRVRLRLQLGRPPLRRLPAAPQEDTARLPPRVFAATPPPARRRRSRSFMPRCAGASGRQWLVAATMARNSFTPRSGPIALTSGSVRNRLSSVARSRPAPPSPARSGARHAASPALRPRRAGVRHRPAGCRCPRTPDIGFDDGAEREAVELPGIGQVGVDQQASRRASGRGSAPRALLPKLRAAAAAVAGSRPRGPAPRLASRSRRRKSTGVSPNFQPSTSLEIPVAGQELGEVPVADRRGDAEARGEVELHPVHVLEIAVMLVGRIRRRLAPAIGAVLLGELGYSRPSSRGRRQRRGRRR